MAFVIPVILSCLSLSLPLYPKRKTKEIGVATGVPEARVFSRSPFLSNYNFELTLTTDDGADDDDEDSHCATIATRPSALSSFSCWTRWPRSRNIRPGAFQCSGIGSLRRPNQRSPEAPVSQPTSRMLARERSTQKVFGHIFARSNFRRQE